MAGKRKAILYCSVGILSLALVASCHPNIDFDPREPNTQQEPLYGTVEQVAFTANTPPESDFIDHGARIYNEAMRLLAKAPYKRGQRRFEKTSDSSLSILSSELFHHKGLVPTTFRLVTQSFTSVFSSSAAKEKSSSSSPLSSSSSGGDSASSDSASSDSARDEKVGESVPRHDHPKLAKALDLLHEAAMDYGNDDALMTLANIYFNGQYKTRRDLSQAFDYYAALADRSGNATAQQMVGFMYSTGIGEAVERDEPRALLYTSFAASANNTAALMTMGYKHLLGIGTTRNCDRAIYYYRLTADKAFAKFKSGPPGGRTMPSPKARLTDQEGGTYGPGASGHDNNGPPASKKEIEEFLKFNEKFAADGESAQARQAQYEIGVFYYTGIAGITPIDRDYAKAADYLHRFADSFFSNKGKGQLLLIKEQRPEDAQNAGVAAALLGKMYWRGEGFDEVDEVKARDWFERGEILENSIAMNALGCMYRDGVAGLPIDLQRAEELFIKAANKHNAEAQVNLGRLLLTVNDRKSNEHARQLFEQAASAHNFEAFYYLGDMLQHGRGGLVNCERAAMFFKIVTERGDWGDELLPGAFKDYQDGDIESAAIGYLLAANQGIEIGQSNFAWIIDRELPTSYYLSLLASRSASEMAAKLALAESPLSRLGSPARLLEMALVYWTRSANQNNVDARIKMGDYYYVGIGAKADHSKALKCYQAAAQDKSPLAFWNLGWMYENGIGVEQQDFFMAKKYYDLSLANNRQAYLPVTLSLLKLNMRYMWSYLTGGDASDAKGGLWSISGGASGKGATEEDVDATDDQKDGGAAGGTQREASDMNSESERIMKARKKHGIYLEGDGSDHDDLEGHDLDEEDELLDFVVIVGLFAVVAYLMYVRQFRFGGNQQQQQQQNQDHQPAVGANGQPIAGLPGDPHNPGRYAYAAAGG